MKRQGVVVIGQRKPQVGDRPYRKKRLVPRWDFPEHIDPEVPIRLFEDEELEEVDKAIEEAEPLSKEPEPEQPVLTAEPVGQGIATEGLLLEEAIWRVLTDDEGLFFSATEITESIIEAGLASGAKSTIASKVSHTLLKLREEEPTWLVFTKDGRKYLYRATAIS